MKRIYHILLAALLLVPSCAKIGPAPNLLPENRDVKVPIAFNLLIPSDGASTKAMADEPEIDHISVAVFGPSGFFNEWVVATIDNVEEVNYDGTPQTKYNIRVNLTMSDSRLRLHFIANGPAEAPLTGQPSKDSEDGMMARLTSSLAWDYNDGYWQKVVLPLGVHAQTWYNEETQTIEYYKVDGQYVPTEETVEQFPDPIKLVRNFARIQVKLATDTQGNIISDLESISNFALAYVPMEGAFAPMMPDAVTTDEYGRYTEQETEYLERFVPGYSDLALDDLKAAPYNYKGYFPATIQLGGYGEDKSRPYPNADSEMQVWGADKYLYVYERTIPTGSRPATRLVIKARHKRDGVKYYRIDLHDGGANYALLRNYTYVVTIGSVADGTGRDNPKDAAESPSTSDVSSEITDLPEVSDGVAQIAVSFIENTYVEGEVEKTLDFQFTPLIGEGVDNTKVSFKLGIGVGNEFEENGTSGNGPAIAGTPTISATSPNEGWGRITFMLAQNDANKFQTIRVIGKKNDGTIVYRDVVIYLKMKQVMTVECLDKYVLEEQDEKERVRVYIPGDLSRSMFPLDFMVEHDGYALNPDGQNMPVNHGTSLTGSGKTVFYFIRTVTKAEYDALPSLEGDSRKYFECNFKTTEAQSAGYVWVSNKYFHDQQGTGTDADPYIYNRDNFYNYTKRLFTDYMFLGRVADGGDVSFTFTMDEAHTGTDKVLPDVVTVKLTGLEPKDGYTALTPVEGKVDVYHFEPEAATATFELTATADDYSINLSTVDNPNPLLYDPVSRTKADPAPSVTRITITPSPATVFVNRTRNLTANLEGQMTDMFNVEWSSSDESVATVNANGVVTGRAAGTATIIASAGGQSAEVSITVRAPIVLETNAATMPNGTSYEVDGITITFGNVEARGADYIQYNTRSSTASDRRFTVSINGGRRLIRITPEFSVNNGTISTNTGTYSGGVWTGSANSVQFNSTRIGNNVTHTRLVSIEVEYE